MHRILQAVAPRLFVALLFASLVGVVGCGGGAGKKDDDAGDDPAPVFDLGGTVVDDDGVPIADAEITARLGDGSDGVLDTATSAADGTYSVRLPEKTPFYLHVEKAGYADTNSHVRELTAARLGVDVTLLLQVQADSLLLLLGGPLNLTSANLLFQVRAIDPAGAELADVTLDLTPIGLLRFYRLADDSGYSTTGPTVACTAGGGCDLPQMAGYSQAIDQGVYVFRFAQAGVGNIANVAAPLKPGEVTFVVND